MPTLTYDGQSFSWNGRRLWLVGVNLEYALLARERWHDAIASLRQMGFNTIRASVPWCMHEVRRGRFDFGGGLDLAAFARECRAQGMHLVLRVGPVVGEPFTCRGFAPGSLASHAGRPPPSNGSPTTGPMRSTRCMPCA
ncbi:MAG: beta-galactosidase, partial [Planctomycetota bacterium]